MPIAAPKYALYWSNGVYFLNVNDGQGLVSRKIVKG
ncbi:MAG: hypothetical protein RIR11_4814 [Bacteroidota bacterium]|jgi:hypothetical protein